MSNLEVLAKRLDSLEKYALEQKVRVKLQKEERLKLELKVVEQRDLSKILAQVSELFKLLGGETQEELLVKLGKFVSYGLSAVFGDAYIFTPVMSVESKDVVVDFQIETGDLKSGITNAKGGGVAEVVSILLQIFFLVALKDKYAPFLFLDTAMVHISKQYHVNVSNLLKELSDKLGIQIVLIVNVNTYGAYADKIYHFRQEGGKTIVEKEK